MPTTLSHSTSKKKKKNEDAFEETQEPYTIFLGKYWQFFFLLACQTSLSLSWLHLLNTWRLLNNLMLSNFGS